MSRERALKQSRAARPVVTSSSGRPVGGEGGFVAAGGVQEGVAGQAHLVAQLLDPAGDPHHPRVAFEGRQAEGGDLAQLLDRFAAVTERAGDPVGHGQPHRHQRVA